MRFENQTFTQQTVTLDYNEFHNCTFDNCVIQFAGGTFTVAGACAFRSLRFAFADAADRTLDFIRFLYSMPNGAELFAQVLASKATTMESVKPN